MIIFFSVIAAVIPMLTYLFLIWRFDRYDREPALLILVNYFWGAVGAIVLTLLFGSILDLLISLLLSEGNHTELIRGSLSAPIIEEITKGFFLLLMVQNKKFDNITDGIVYGGAIGLGFGMTENFMYFIAHSSSFQAWIFVVIIRTLFSAVMHCVATGTLGAFLGYAKFKKRIWKVIFALTGLIIAMVIHSVWNSFISFESFAWVGFAFMAVTIIIFIFVFNFSISSERKIIFSELQEETQNGLIPAEHLSILNSSKRNKFGWIDEGIRKVYVSSAIGLAFRKNQFKNSFGLNKNYYGAEVDNLRKIISVLLRKEES
jgi:RsiW-degrading membrane proteinase PrsW (M82 family)